MKFLVDVCIGAATENLLKQNFSHDLLFVRDINAKMKDDEIIKLANLEERIIITADKDFGELVYQKQMKNQGVLLLRTHDLPYEEKAKLIIKIH